MKYFLFANCLLAFFAVSFSDGSVNLGFPKILAAPAEWEYKRDPLEKDFGGEVFSRQPVEDEDLLKVYEVKNFRLYEDDEWTYSEGGTLKDIDFKRTNKKDALTPEYKTWNIFAQIAGEEFVKKYVTGYISFRDSDSNLLGYVWKGQRKEPGWVLGMNVNAADFNNKKWQKDTTIVLLHEYAHILTLNKSQVEFSKKNVITCKGKTKSVATAVGCAYKSSYASKFVTTFWSEADHAHAAKIADTENQKKVWKLLEKYYKANTNSFVNIYATSNPEEDLAETFTDFILLSKPATSLTEKDQKILFFYQFPELVTERSKIREKLQSTFVGE